MGRSNKGGFTSTNEAEELDALNAELKRRRNTPERVRRRVEATIEAKARKRRGREVPASAAWKQ